MFDRITSDPAILGGKPVVKGTRISVEMILEWMASGQPRRDSRPLSSSDRGGCRASARLGRVVVPR
jgi:hypothetical protein